jgi:hypothetical protein
MYGEVAARYLPAQEDEHLFTSGIEKVTVLLLLQLLWEPGRSNREILGRLSRVFLMVEGGPRAGHEAEVASSHGALVIPVGRSGGYAAALFGRSCRPPAIDTSIWAALGSSEFTPEETARAVLHAVQVCVESAG